MLLAACAISLILDLHAGSRVVETSSYDDHVNWVLPPAKLEGFRRAGVVIDEDKRTTIVATTTVSRTPHSLMDVVGTLSETATDVPRRRTTHETDQISTSMTARNTAVPASRLDLEEAAMVELPAGPVCVGQTWRTRLPVMTTLGSGTATIDHTVVKTDGDIVEVAVKGYGVISGVEYNLPRLLPGAIAIAGTARFDRSLGAVTSENYEVHNRLIRTVKGQTIGFLETETVAIKTTVMGSRPASAAAPASTMDPHRRRAGF